MKKAIGIGLLISFIGYFSINEFYIKNSYCKTENGQYEVYGNTPVNITKRIKDGDCECISESLIVEKKTKQFTQNQLDEIKKQLPDWIIKNYNNVSVEKKEKFIKDLNELSIEGFHDKLKYRYTFFPFIGSVPVYTFQINDILVYCPNYAYVYDLYDGKYSNKNDGKEPFGKKPDYPIIESQSWAKKQFGEKGIVN